MAQEHNRAVVPNILLLVTLQIKLYPLIITGYGVSLEMSGEQFSL